MLNAKKARFCELYALSGNGSKAYIEAGYAETGAKQNAYKALQEPEVIAYIEEVRAELIQNADISPDMIIRELKAVAFSNITDFVSANQFGIDVKDIDSLPGWKTAAIAEMSETTNDFGGSAKKLKLHPKLDALGKLAKIAGLGEPKPDDDLPSAFKAGDFVLKRRHRTPEAAADSSVSASNTP